MDGKSHFLVADRKCSKKNNQALTKVRHYIDSYPAIKNLTDFHLEREFDCKETNIEECQLTERSYIIKQKDDKKVIYNFKQATIAFDEVYNDENLRELLGENKVLVSKKLYAPHSQFIEDTITFGINPDTLEENTPIWSDLQQRNVSSYSEILKYLSLTEQYVDEPVGVYTYDKGTDLNDRNGGIQVINTQFVKKFTSSFNNTN